MKAAILSSFSKRFRGLLPGSPARDSSFAVFVPCRDIHTFGMDAPHRRGVCRPYGQGARVEARGRSARARALRLGESGN